MVVLQALISLCIAGAGVFVLTHVSMLASALQGLYVRQAEKVQAKHDFRSYMFNYNPETWKTPFATFLFKTQMVILGIILIIIAYPIVFGPIVL